MRELQEDRRNIQIRIESRRYWTAFRTSSATPAKDSGAIRDTILDKTGVADSLQADLISTEPRHLG